MSDEGNFFGVFRSCVSGGESMSVSQLFFLDSIAEGKGCGFF